MEDRQKEVHELINQGLSAFYKEYHGQAEEIFLKALELDPDNAEVQYQLGSACYYQDRLGEALGYYKKAVELSPDDPHYNFVLGYSLKEDNDLNGAVEALEKSIALDNSDIQVYKNLGETYYLLGEYDKSSESFKEVVNMDSQLENCLYLYISLRRAGKENDAKEILQKANTNVNKGDASYLILRLYLGFIDVDLLQQKAGERVIPCTLYYHCGMGLLFNGKQKEACDFFQKCIDTKLKYIFDYRRAEHELGICNAS